MESDREQPTRKVLRADSRGTKETEERNTRMGKASGGDCQNPRGVVKERCHVVFANSGGRAPGTPSKGSGRPGAGRGTVRLYRDGPQRKSKTRHEPRGCASSGPSGDGESRSDEGSRTHRRLGVSCGDMVAGHTVWTAPAPEAARPHRSVRAYAPHRRAPRPPQPPPLFS